MKKTAVLFFVVSVLFFCACHKKEMVKNTGPNNPDNTSNAVNETKKASIDMNADMVSTGSPYKTDSISINANILSIFVNYAGGCKEHSFQLVSDGMYAKSMPPQLWLSLKHYANDDQCKKLIIQELKFDVSDLKYKGNNTVILKLGDKKVAYTD